MSLKCFETYSVRYSCEDGWKLKDKKCYAFFDIKKKYLEAHDHCLYRNNSQLVQIYSADENAFVTGLINGVTYMGLASIVPGGNYSWIGTPSGKVMYKRK